jgi:two-component system, cell cycle response regulator DivK
MPAYGAGDEKDSRSLFRRLLEFYGFSVMEAADGLEALQKARQARPRLILLDLSMPRLDGWQVAQAMRADSRFLKVPIIAVSANARPGDRTRALAAGCDDYLLKPFEVTELVEKVCHQLEVVPA